MKKKYFTALLLGSSFFLLTGFDSNLSPQEIMDSANEAMANFSSVSGDLNFQLNMDLAVSSSEDETLPSASMSALMRVDGDYTILRDSSMEYNLDYKFMIPGDELQSSMRFYRVPGWIDNFDHYLYTDTDPYWVRFTLPDELEQSIQALFSLFGQGAQPDSFFSDQTPYDASDSQETPYDQQAIQELFSLSEADNPYENLTLSPQPVEVDGISCYELKQTMSFKDSPIEYSPEILYELYGLNEDDFSEEEKEILKQITDLSMELLDTLSVNVSYYVNDSTFELVKETIDLSGWDMSAFLNGFLSFYQETAQLYGEAPLDTEVPNLNLSFPTLTYEITFRLDETDEIKIPSGALYAQDIDLDDVYF